MTRLPRSATAHRNRVDGGNANAGYACRCGMTAAAYATLVWTASSSGSLSQMTLLRPLRLAA